MSKIYKVGIIGTGFGTKVHFPAFQAHNRFEVVGLAGRNEDKTEKLATELEIPFWTSNWKKLVKIDEIDLIAVTTPPYLHYEMGKKVLKKGKHLLLEKPTANNAFEVKKLLRMAESSNLVGMMAHEFRNLPVRAYFRDLLQEGRIGTVRELHFNQYFSWAANPKNPKFGWLWDNRFEGGMLGAMGSHQFDMIRSILGEEITELQGRLFTRMAKREDREGKMCKVTADDGYSVIFETEMGVTGNLITSTTLGPAPPTRFIVGGTSGTLYLENNKIYEGSGNEFMELEIPEKYNLDTSLQEKDYRIPPFMKLLDSLSQALDEGKSHSPSLEDGWRNQELLDAVKDSHRTGTRIIIPR